MLCVLKNILKDKILIYSFL